MGHLYHGYVKFNSSPWKITMLLRTVNHLFLWAIYTMAMLNNQRVTFKATMKHQEVHCELRSTKGGVREFIARGGGRGLTGPN